MASTVQSRKAKGRRFQQYIAKRISELLGIPWGSEELIRSREMGQKGVDVVLIGEALERLNLAIECKNQEKFNIPAWVKQTKENQKEGTEWALFCKRNHEDPIVIISDEYFWKLQEELIKWRETYASN